MSRNIWVRLAAPALVLALAAPAGAAGTKWSGWISSAKGRKVPHTSVTFRYSGGRMTSFSVHGALIACVVAGSPQVTIHLVALSIPSVKVKNGRFSTTYHFGKHNGDAYDKLRGVLHGSRASGTVEQHTKLGPCDTHPLSWVARAG